MAIRIGLISDTHSLLRPQALSALQGCDQIIHGGDIGTPQILEALRTIAPLTVVRGNNDSDDAWAGEVPFEATVYAAGVAIYVTHILADVPPVLPADVKVVVTGHSHKPLMQWREGVLFINPGSAGPRRFKLPISVALLHIDDAQVHGEIIDLSSLV